MEALRFSSRHRPPRAKPSSGSLAHPPLHIPPRLATHPPPHLTVTSTGNVHLVTAGLSANGAAASQRGARGHTPGSTLHVSTAPHLPPRQRASVLASQRLSISVTFHGSRAYRPTALIVQAALGLTELFGTCCRLRVLGQRNGTALASHPADSSRMSGLSTVLNCFPSDSLNSGG